MTFLHPGLDLNQLGLLKVIKDDRLVDEEDRALVSTMISTRGVEASFERNEGYLSQDEG